MNDESATGVLDDLLDPLSRCLDAESARRVAEFRVAPVVQEGIDILADRANEGILTEDERAEYEAIINAADFISMLKLKARRNLIERQPRVTSAGIRRTIVEISAGLAAGHGVMASSEAKRWKVAN